MPTGKFKHLVMEFESKYKRFPSKLELTELKKAAIRLEKGEMANKRANKRRR